jgi:hypothetical protein
MSGLDEGLRRRTAKVYKDWHDAMADALREVLLFDPLNLPGMHARYT